MFKETQTSNSKSNFDEFDLDKFALREIIKIYRIFNRDSCTYERYIYSYIYLIY